MPWAPLYKSFDWSILNDPGFKEDSVREELISPLLVRLGYSASGLCRIHRSRPLKHPFVYLGSRSHRISLIPDYVLEVGGHPRWILDAKAPSESIHEGKNPQQAYSYAIHPDIRTRYFALCNGHDFVVFDIFRLEAILDFKLQMIADHWEDLASLVSADRFPGSIDQLNPDLGLHLHRLGMSHFEALHFIGIAVPLVARINEEHFSISGQYSFGEECFCASFDFHQSLLDELLNLFPEPTRSMATSALTKPPQRIDLRAVLPHVSIECTLSKHIDATFDRSEEFCPLTVRRFSRG